MGPEGRVRRPPVAAPVGRRSPESHLYGRFLRAVRRRLAPLSGLNGIADADPAETQGHVAARLNDLGIAYLHAADTDVMRGAAPQMEAILPFIRPRFRGPLMLNGACDPPRAAAEINQGDADLVAFGRLYLANPDLPERIRARGPL